MRTGVSDDLRFVEADLVGFRRIGFTCLFAERLPLGFGYGGSLLGCGQGVHCSVVSKCVVLVVASAFWIKSQQCLPFFTLWFNRCLRNSYLSLKQEFFG